MSDRATFIKEKAELQAQQRNINTELEQPLSSKDYREKRAKRNKIINRIQEIDAQLTAIREQEKKHGRKLNATRIDADKRLRDIIHRMLDLQERLTTKAKAPTSTPAAKHIYASVADEITAALNP